MTALLAVVAQATPRQPLPAEPPVQGWFWYAVIPAALFLVSAFGTWALWRHFAREDDEE
ncbi:MAG: hypothetical protein PVJ02_14980 [Gemmatimonadota bacterium]|jgi:hypothetical protein